MPTRWGSEPAFEFAGPGHLGELFAKSIGLIRPGKSDEVDVLEDTAVPPGCQAGVFATERLGINPGAIAGDGGSLKLIDDGEFEAISEIALALELAEKLFDNLAGDNDDDNGLHVAGSMRHHLDGPDDLGDGHWRKFFQLELDHGKCFREFAAWELSDAEKHVFGREPGDVQLGLKERPPVLTDQSRWEWFALKAGLLAVESEVAIAGVKLPKVAGVGGDIEDVAGMPAGCASFRRRL